ncbi:putative leucine-rich repeat domain, L domain-containing protein [Medicago truncatula]|uniref:F-box/LRR protein, putative n=1 Tax=Medicago truncatula TaxID=3880 RepID=A0A072UG16_MEDTR|nr:EIN3-binding F-box protein 2 [Medicago truncatula]KEH28632.1 F-box/LRR protein, putative [Medicago truncatula]RHN58441.1 putative leucine-rich repeat domain, L domain-containing protein [Medicago truncatula]
MVMISNCFPSLEELDLSNPKKDGNFAAKAMLLELPKLHKVNLSGHHYANDSLLLHLCKNCVFLQEILMLNTYNLTDNDIASAIRERPGLRSISITRMTFGNLNIFIQSLVNLMGLTCLDLSYSFIPDELLSSVAEKGLPIRKLFLQGCFDTYVGIFNLLSKCQFIQYLDLQNSKFMNDLHVIELSSFLSDLLSINISKCDSLTHLALFALLKNCVKLSDVKMEYTTIGKMSVENSYTLMDFDVYPQLKSLRLANNPFLRDEDIDMFVSVFPNLQLLDLSYFYGISTEGIGQVLRKSSKIRHLN